MSTVFIKAFVLTICGAILLANFVSAQQAKDQPVKQNPPAEGTVLTPEEEAAKKAAEEAAKTGNNGQGKGEGDGGNSIYNPNNPSVPRGKGKAKGNPHVSPA